MESRHASIWTATSRRTSYPKVSASSKSEVVVVGGGIAGLMCAYELQSKGKNVTLVEAGRIAEGTTGFTTAKVTIGHGAIYSFIKNHFGFEKASIFAHSNQRAIEHLATIIETEKIECGFEITDAFLYSANDTQNDEVTQEYEILHQAGLPVHILHTLDHFPPKATSALKIEHQAQFHPRAFLLELASRFVSKGGTIFENSRVTKLEDGAPIKLSINEQTIEADDVVIATNYPIFDHDHLYLRLNQMRSYALAFPCPSDFPEGMYIGLGDDEFTYRTYSGEDTRWLIVGGNAHPTGQEEDTQNYLEEFKLAVMSRFAIKEIKYEWSAQDATSLDRVPLIGKMPAADHIYLATGFGEWGMSTGVVSGMLISDLLTGKTNQSASLYDPKRLNVLAMAGELKDLSCGVLKGYSSRVIPFEKRALGTLPKGEGTVVTREGKTIAVSRDEKGSLCALSAICTHMGCVVNWNTMERSWDCPCHGSRFSNTGEVIHGPATKALESLTV